MPRSVHAANFCGGVTALGIGDCRGTASLNWRDHQVWKNRSKKTLTQRQARSSGSINAFVKVAYEAFDTDSEYIADSQQRAHCDRASCLNLLPMPSRESEGNHVLLAVALILA
jgi:hypothetical protein